MKSMIANFGVDARCEVHQTVLGIREGKEGWFDLFCPGEIACDDEGELYGIMVSVTACDDEGDLYGIMVSVSACDDKGEFKEIMVSGDW